MKIILYLKKNNNDKRTNSFGSFNLHKLIILVRNEWKMIYKLLIHAVYIQLDFIKYNIQFNFK